MPMYQHILIPLDNSPSDEAILVHIRPLARLTHAKLTLIHVADGFMARHQKRLGESPEIQDDRDYLRRREEELRAEGFEVKAILACGEPAKNILAVAHSEKCDLIAMSTHGHKFFSDFVFGSVANELRHLTNIPLLMVRAN
jgi:nucleotide-binding universal stress UspA family protein